LLRTLLDQRGGFTVNGRDGRLVDDGVAVCIDPSAGFVFDFTAWCDEEVQGWLDRATPRLGGDVHLGGWLDGTGRCWLDLVRVFHRQLLDHAIHVGRTLGQWAAFDLTQRSLIHLSLATRTGSAVVPRPDAHVWKAPP
jgi:hypothetical protein